MNSGIAFQNPAANAAPQFYYLNASNEAVGPFTLDELQRLVGRGISSATLIAQAGTSEWLPLQSLLEVPAPIMPAAPETLPNAADIRGEKSLKSRRTAFLVFAVFVGFQPLGIAIGALNFAPAGFFGLYYVLSLLTLGMVLHLHAEAWRALPMQLRWTTPGKASWLMLIPFFNLYWAFRSWPKLAEGYENWQKVVLGRVEMAVKPLGYAFAATWLFYVIEGLLGTMSFGYVISYGLLVVRFVLFLLFYRRLDRVLNALSPR